MSLGITKLNIQDATTIRESILENQCSDPGQQGANGRNIVGTINTIIEKAGSGGGGGTYTAGDGIYISSNNEISVVGGEHGLGPGPGTTYPVCFSRIWDAGIFWPDCTDMCYIGWSLAGWYTGSASMLLVNPLATLGTDHGVSYDINWDSPPQDTRPEYCIRCWRNDNRSWEGKAPDWGGNIMWIGNNSLRFYKDITMTAINLNECKTVYNRNENHKLELDNLFLQAHHPSITNEPPEKYTIHPNSLNLGMDDSQINWDVPGVYPVYFSLVFCPNKLKIDITIQ